MSVCGHYRRSHGGFCTGRELREAGYGAVVVEGRLEKDLKLLTDPMMDCGKPGVKGGEGSASFKLCRPLLLLS